MSFILETEESPEINLAPASETEEILQNGRMILSAPLGSVPLNRSFGIDFAMLDRNTPAAEALAISGAVEALSRWEPRLNVVEAWMEADETKPGKSKIRVEVEIGG